MVYSKILKHSKRAISQSLNILNYSHGSVKPYLLNSTLKLSSNGSFTYISNHQYSTVLSLKLHQQSKPVPKYTSPLNLAAFISTSGSDDKYQIIITNPAEGTSSTLNSSLGSPINAIQNPEELLIPTSDIADTATSLTNELASVAELVEPSLTSLGLANWTPVGLVQMFMEYLHVSLQCPWWIAIVACTVTARILLLPLLIKTQRNSLHMANHMPQLQYLQAKFGEARRTGNSMEASRYASEMMTFMKDKNISPLKNSILPMLQAPVFISFFLALRAMAKAPVESMKYGGLWWVTDLTIPDPYYILPVLSCSTLYVVLKIGAESGIKMENLKMAKYFLQAIPVIALPFCINFPSAVLYYWVTTNFCTLVIVSVLKIKPVREYFNLPTQVPIDPKFARPKKGFMKEVKDAFEDQKILATVEDRRRMDTIRFQKAGTGPIPRTYSYDPTKPRPSNVASITNKNIVAKERKV